MKTVAKAWAEYADAEGIQDPQQRAALERHFFAGARALNRLRSTYSDSRSFARLCDELREYHQGVAEHVAID